MEISSMLTPFHKLTNARPSPVRRQSTRKPCVEILEDRQLLASSLVDQSLLVNQGFFARFGIGAGNAQTFKPVNDNITRASVQTHLNCESTGDVTIPLYDALPINGGSLLASGTAPNISAGDLAIVEFGYIPIT